MQMGLVLFALDSVNPGLHSSYQGRKKHGNGKKYGNVRGEVRVNFLALFASKPHMFMCGALKLSGIVRANFRLNIAIAMLFLSLILLIRDAPDTFNFLRHVMRAICSVRPKCSHRCVSLKETL